MSRNDIRALGAVIVTAITVLTVVTLLIVANSGAFDHSTLDGFYVYVGR